MTSLEQAAFGDRPDLDIGTPAEPRQRWLAAVVLGGQGRYAAAAALLDPLRTDRDPVLAALAASTLASHRRQLGGHAAARALDAAALHRLIAAGRFPTALGTASATTLEAVPAGARNTASSGAPEIVSAAGPDTAPGGAREIGSAAGPGAVSGTAREAVSGGGPETMPAGGRESLSGGAREIGSGGGRESKSEAVADVLLGLAADALGLGRLGEARRLAAAARRVPGAGWRAAVRLAWVSAEIELSCAGADLAVKHAEQAFELAADAGAVRHRIKSALVLGAALVAAGQRERARPLVASARDDAIDLGLLSLVWPGALILAELDPAAADEHCRCAVLALHSVLRRADPVGRRLAERSPWVPRLAGPTG